MAVSSLILGILALLISFTIFKDLSLILAILGLVLGAISFFKKKSKGMCIAGIILTILSLVCVFSEDSVTELTNSNVEIQQCKVGDTVNVKNSSDEYTVTITGIKETQERNEFSEKNPEQVFIIDYTYSCITSKDDVYVSDMNFKVIDENGEIGETYPVTDIKDAQSITSGVTCTAQMAFGVTNKSSKIKLQFFDNMFDSQPNAVYELDINN